MATDDPTQDQVDQVNFLQREIEKAVLPYRENTEAALVIAALNRVSRILLRLYPEELQQQLILATVAYLKGQDLEEDAARADGIVLPKGIM